MLDTSDKHSSMLSDDEYAAMMRDFRSASDWMAEQLAAKRASPCSDQVARHDSQGLGMAGPN